MTVINWLNECSWFFIPSFISTYLQFLLSNDLSIRVYFLAPWFWVWSCDLCLASKMLENVTYEKARKNACTFLLLPFSLGHHDGHHSTSYHPGGSHSGAEPCYSSVPAEIIILEREHWSVWKEPNFKERQIFKE